jgi:hypothetical protein
MNSTWRWSVALAATVMAVTLTVGAARAEDADGNGPVKFKQRDLSGPRLGLTYILGDGEVWQEVQENGVGRVISQFGWHFEHQIMPKGGGPQFVIEGIPLIGGVEYGKVIPSATLAMGVRFPSGYEFGLGPNLAVVSKEGDVRSSLVIALGKSFDYSGVVLPVNLVMTTSPKGQRLSVLLGYAIQRSTSFTP